MLAAVPVVLVLNLNYPPPPAPNCLPIMIAVPVGIRLFPLFQFAKELGYSQNTPITVGNHSFISLNFEFIIFLIASLTLIIQGGVFL